MQKKMNNGHASQMVGSIWLEGRMSRTSLLEERKAMEAATSVATEAVVSIRTVQSLSKSALCNLIYFLILSTKFVYRTNFTRHPEIIMNL